MSLDDFIVCNECGQWQYIGNNRKIECRAKEIIRKAQQQADKIKVETVKKLNVLQREIDLKKIELKELENNIKKEIINNG